MKLLLVVFKPADLGAAASFGAASGMPFDAVLLTGSGSVPGAGTTWNAALSALPPADGLASGLLSLASGYTHVAAPSSMSSKDAMGRLAGLLSAATVTDVIGIESPMLFKRPLVAGSIIATVEVLETPVVLTFRGSSFNNAQGSADGGSPINLLSDGSTERVSASAGGGSRPELAQAKVVVTGGRPLKDAGTFETIVGGLADKLGGAVGATRAAVDSGIAPNELQVGQTGKIVAPDLYIAAGVSGSTQHMAGIKDSKVIVAINTDADAPIFESADFGLVQDLFTALPELQSKL